MVSWSDRALADINGDKLDRRRLVDSLAGLLSGDGLDTPLVVGVYGDWGSGKTTVMRMLRSKLEPKTSKATNTKQIRNRARPYASGSMPGSSREANTASGAPSFSR